MKILITLILLLFCNLTFGQTLHCDSLVNNLIKRLMSNGIDTILIYENRCVGCDGLLVLQKDDSVSFNGRSNIYYIFWKLNGLSYATMLSHYGLYIYDTIPYNMGLVWDSYFKNKKLLKKERILQPSYIDKNDTVFVDIDDYTYSQIIFFDKKEIVSYEINDFYFSKTIDGKYRNLNYERNSKLFQKKIQTQIEKEINNILNNGLIQKQLTTRVKSH